MKLLVGIIQAVRGVITGQLDWCILLLNLGYATQLALKALSTTLLLLLLLR